uniref:Reverse transcriptase N-terminal domain-containing protein n=1 Tax=Cliftonaea pectinata TaxID=2007206 RepID=A0A1Z1MPK6_9FLOR|nr:hypothetical protein [Cliftonaea pectinata]ARW68020.1 hypothetical protein [Cliftonaea pectinata]
MIQNQIYLASRKYNIAQLYKLQQYLLNSNEAKVMCLNLVIQEIYHYYYSNNNENYILKNDNKLLILKYIFNVNYMSNKVYTIVIEYIKKNLIYLCINPEWKAKFIYNSNFQINTSNYRLYPMKCFSYINKNYLINLATYKLKSFSYIKELIKKLLNYNHHTNFSVSYNLKCNIKKNKIINYTNLNNLYKLFINVLKIDACWYLFALNKNKSIELKYHFFMNRYKSIEYKKKPYLYIMKSLLYNKKYFSFKLKSSLKTYDLLFRISHNVYLYYKSRFLFTSIKTIYIINKFLNITIFQWLKKKNKSNFYILNIINTSINNYILNYNIYYLNIYNYFYL